MNTKALRQKILDLAIHGKLVPQDPNDEPASVLLERIRAEKERLIKEGKIKKPKKTKATCDKPQYPYQLPEGWVWCKLEDIAYVASGSTPDKSSFVSEGIPYIKMYNLRNQEIDFDYKSQYIKEEVHNGKLQRSRTEVGDLIMNIVGPPLGKLALIPKSLPQANFNQAAVLIRPYLHKDIINVYLKAYLEEMSEINSISTKGSAGQINISLTQSQNMRIPLPPLQEQIRINNELRKWITFVEQIEDGRETLNLVIKQTKSKILDLAIHGKLVPQDPNDEPATELLKRINPMAEITCDNPQYGKLPKGWCYCRLDSLCRIKGGKRIPRGMTFSNVKTKYIYIRVSDMKENTIVTTDLKYIDKDVYEQIKNYTISSSDLYLTIAGTIGKVGIVPVYLDGMNLTENAAKLTEIVCDKKYLLYSLLSTQVQEHFKSKFHQVAQPKLSIETASSAIISLPPLSEQYRIVAKIEKLFALLDKIEASL